MADIRRRLDEFEHFRKQADEKLAELRKANQTEAEQRRQNGRGRNVTDIRNAVRRPIAKPGSKD
jgi:hypothetical protein